MVQQHNPATSRPRVVTSTGERSQEEFSGMSLLKPRMTLLAAMDAAPDAAAQNLHKLLKNGNLEDAETLLRGVRRGDPDKFGLVLEKFSALYTRESSNVAGLLKLACINLASKHNLDPLPVFKMLVEHPAVDPELKMSLVRYTPVASDELYRSFRRSGLSDHNEEVRAYVYSSIQAKISGMTEGAARTKFEVQFVEDVIRSPFTDIHLKAADLILGHVHIILRTDPSAKSFHTMIRTNHEFGGKLYDRIMRTNPKIAHQYPDFARTIKESTNPYIFFRQVCTTPTMDKIGNTAKIFSGEIKCPGGEIGLQDAAVAALVALSKVPEYSKTAKSRLETSPTIGNLGALRALASGCIELKEQGVPLYVAIAERLVSRPEYCNAELLQLVERHLLRYPAQTVEKTAATAALSNDEICKWRLKIATSSAVASQQSELSTHTNRSNLTPEERAYRYALSSLEGTEPVRTAAIKHLSSEVGNLISPATVCADAAMLLLGSSHADVRVAACKLLEARPDVAADKIKLLKSVLRHDPSGEVKLATDAALTAIGVWWGGRVWASWTAPQLPALPKISFAMDAVDPQNDGNFMHLINTSFPDVKEVFPDLEDEEIH